MSTYEDKVQSLQSKFLRWLKNERNATCVKLAELRSSGADNSEFERTEQEIDALCGEIDFMKSRITHTYLQLPPTLERPRRHR